MDGRTRVGVDFKLIRVVAAAVLALGAMGALTIGCSADGLFAESAGAHDPTVTDTRGQHEDARDEDTRESGDSAKADSVWPPELEPLNEAIEIDPSGGLYTFLEGEVTLLVPVGAFAEKTTVELTRRIVGVGGIDYVGYIWGPHLVGVAQAAKMTVRAPKAWIPPGTEPGGAGLLMIENATELVPLDSNRVEAETQDDIVLSGKLNALGEVVIGPLPLP